MNNLTLRLIEDQPDLRELLRDRLATAGYQVLEAASGREGLDGLRSHAVDVALVDIRLPDMTGIAVLERVQRISPDTVMVVMTVSGAGDGRRVAPPRRIRLPDETVRMDGARESSSPACRAPNPEEDRPERLGQTRRIMMPVMDIDEFRERCGNDPAVMSEIIQMFLDRLEDLIDGVRDALAQADADAVTQAVHSLRGYFINFSAERVCRVALELEERARLGDLTGGSALLERIESGTRVLESFLGSMIGDVA
jgi:CheY-like chemotaxis protein/HPt (histidine-containing phosphotransfer) domain-containing protein